jgi:hypothetical protein
LELTGLFAVRQNGPRKKAALMSRQKYGQAFLLLNFFDNINFQTNFTEKRKILSFEKPAKQSLFVSQAYCFCTAQIPEFKSSIRNIDTNTVIIHTA